MKKIILGALVVLSLLGLAQVVRADDGCKCKTCTCSPCECGK